MAKLKLEVKKSKDKVIYNNTTVLDKNFIENPLFICNLKEETTTVKKVEEVSDLSGEAKKVIRTLSQNQNKETLSVVYRTWFDSKGIKKELLIANSFPTFQTQDIWNGLIGLYLKKITPIAFNEEDGGFSLEYDTMEFSLYELAKFMNRSVGGKSLDMIDSEILKLENATYYNFSSNIIFDKKNEGYLNTDRKGISFVYNYQKSSRKNLKSGSTTDKCSIQFNRVIIDNIRYEYFKYMNPSIYFSLPSRGITRRLYTYIIGTRNTYSDNEVAYMKRNIFLLANKLPIYPQARSKIKEKMNIGLKYLKQHNIITDYFYGDETIINGIKEDVIYFVTKGNKLDVLQQISNKQLELEIAVEINDGLEIPNDIKQELLTIGVSEDKVYELIKTYDKWKIIKYILWFKEEMNKAKGLKAENPAGVVIFAIESGKINLDLRHKHIVDFVENEKLKTEKKKELTDDYVKKLYDDYIRDEMKKFKSEDEFGYNILYSNILDTLNAQADNKIGQIKLLIKNSVDEDIISGFNNQIKDYEEFKDKQEKSKLFIKGFNKESMTYRKLKSYDEFKKGYMTK